MIDIAEKINKYPFYVEVRYVKRNITNISYDGELSVKSNVLDGYMVKVCEGGKGYAWSNDLTKLHETIQLAKKRIKKDSNFHLNYSQIKDRKSYAYSFPELEEKVNIVKQAYSLEQINYLKLSLRDIIEEKIFVNNRGADIYQKFSRVYFSCLSMLRDGKIESNHERLASFKYDFDLVDLVMLSNSRVKELVNAERLSSGRYEVILDPNMTGLFAHEVVGHASEADSVLEGDSVFAGKLGKKIANEKISLVDDPRYPSFGLSFYDDEGFPADRVNIIESGVLKNFLTNSETAELLGVENNGHSRAEFYDTVPIVRMYNTMILPLNEEVFYDNAILVEGTKGGSVDTFNGNYMFTAQRAYLIKNGEKEKLLKNVSISGNIFETLNNVVAVGKQISLDPGFCGKNGQSVPVSDGGPYLRVKNMLLV